MQGSGTRAASAVRRTQPPTRAIETLARDMYSATSIGGVPWIRCGWNVRKTWLDNAWDRMEGSGPLVQQLGFLRRIQTTIFSFRL